MHDTKWRIPFQQAIEQFQYHGMIVGNGDGYFVHISNLRRSKLFDDSQCGGASCEVTGKGAAH
ncbi:hypothetical protein [Burkholderia ubonensis]|uniref:hypothetical protein n=1 Tax=Burkholderia ubonensis TaxID=101571 RepID=UPI0039EB5513